MVNNICKGVVQKVVYSNTKYKQRNECYIILENYFNWMSDPKVLWNRIYKQNLMKFKEKDVHRDPKTRNSLVHQYLSIHKIHF